MWKESNGYWRMYVNGKNVLVHRYIWEQVNGKIPDGYDVHHGDGKGNFDGEGNKNCNCISNLRLMESVEHQRLHNNGKVASEETKIKLLNHLHKLGLKTNNISGYRGVHYDKRRSKWYAQIKDGIKYYLGRFDTPEEAARAYDKKARELWGADAFQNFKDE